MIHIKNTIRTVIIASLFSQTILAANNSNTVNTPSAYMRMFSAIDSDSDGINDYLETQVYHTLAFNADTDGDGVSDGDEINNGFNPLKANKQEIEWKKKQATLPKVKAVNGMKASVGGEIQNIVHQKAKDAKLSNVFGVFGTTTDINQKIIKYYKNISEIEKDKDCPNYIFVDVDTMSKAGITLSDLLEITYSKQVGLIFESVSNKYDNVQKFAESEVYGSELPYKLEGLVISVEGEEVQYTGIRKSEISQEKAIAYCFPEFDDQGETEEIPALQASSQDNDDRGPMVGASDVIIKYNTEPDGILDDYTNYYYYRQPTALNVTKTVYTKKGSTYRKMIKKDDDAYSNNKGSCRGQKTVGYSRTITYSKSWTVSINNSFKLKLSPAVEATFGASFSYGQSKSEGTTHSVTKKAYKEHIQGGVFQMVKNCDGYHEGYVTFTVAPKGLPGRATVMKAKSYKVIYDKKANLTFKNTPIPVSNPFYDFNEWGKLLPKCRD